MNSAFRLKENLNIEVSAEKVFSILPAGRIVPATWRQTFTTSAENQRFFDLHLLRGNTDLLVDQVSLGKWRISGIPPAPKGLHRIELEVRIGADGSIGLRAALDEQILPATLLTEPFPKVPLIFRVPSLPPEKTAGRPCPECKSNIVTRAANWKNESFALCLDCGNEFDLTDVPHLGEQNPWENLPPELLKTLGIVPPPLPGGLAAEELQELQQKGFDWSDPASPSLKITIDKAVQQLPGMIARSGKKGADLSAEEIIRLAGEPLPEDRRQRCPKCDAVIAQDARRCDWCGQTL